MPFGQSLTFGGKGWCFTLIDLQVLYHRKHLCPCLHSTPSHLVDWLKQSHLPICRLPLSSWHPSFSLFLTVYNFQVRADLASFQRAFPSYTLWKQEVGVPIRQAAKENGTEICSADEKSLYIEAHCNLLWEKHGVTQCAFWGYTLIASYLLCKPLQMYRCTVVKIMIPLFFFLPLLPGPTRVF